MVSLLALGNPCLIKTDLNYSMFWSSTGIHYLWFTSISTYNIGACVKHIKKLSCSGISRFAASFYTLSVSFQYPALHLVVWIL